MAIVVTLRYDANAFEPKPAGDLMVAIFDVIVAADPNTYPLGGEPIDFSLQFAEAHIVVPTLAFNDQAGAGGVDVDGAMVVGFERDTVNTGRFRFYQGPAGAIANLPELANAVYATPFQFSILVHGRPITDSF